MSGIFHTIILQKEFNENDINTLSMFIESISLDGIYKYKDDDWEFIVKIGIYFDEENVGEALGTYSIFVSKLDKEELEMDVNFQTQFYVFFGFVPKCVLGVTCNLSHPTNRKVVGRLIADILDITKINGCVNLCEEANKEIFTHLKGKIVDIETYQGFNISVFDKEFLKNWLNHPEFYAL